VSTPRASPLDTDRRQRGKGRSSVRRLLGQPTWRTSSMKLRSWPPAQPEVIGFGRVHTSRWSASLPAPSERAGSSPMPRRRIIAIHEGGHAGRPAGLPKGVRHRSTKVTIISRGMPSVTRWRCPPRPAISSQDRVRGQDRGLLGATRPSVWSSADTTTGETTTSRGHPTWSPDGDRMGHSDKARPSPSASARDDLPGS